MKIEEEKVSSGVRADVALGLCVLSIVFLLIVPLPTQVLDILLAFNVGMSVVVLLLTLNTREPLDISTYPTLILLTTLFRLALNVASTRLILLTGNAGGVIDAFGKFVVGGNLIVGVVVFIILVVINFMVITKGATRISEVAARFTLDAMPGKQMAIDADLNSGLITEEQARTRREKISREAEFHGAMDGASKFVRGDALAGLIITAINIVGGTILAITNGAGIAEAVQKYSVLTIGDGLVTQIPAILSSVAAGILVTKTVSKRRFSQELVSQVFSSARTLNIAAFSVALIGFIPGFPGVPFWLLAGVLAFMGRRLNKKAAEPEPTDSPEDIEKEKKGPESTPDELGKLLQVDRMCIEVGFRLIPMAESDKSNGLVDHIQRLRKQFATTTGMIVPLIRMRDSLALDANQYRILVSGQEVGRGTLYPGQWLALNPGTVTETVPGIKAVDPTFGLPAVWIKEDRKLEAETLGYTVVDPIGVVMTHLTETIKNHAHELVSRDDVQVLLDRLKETAPAVVSELTPGILGLGEVQRVLQNLLRERLPIRNLASILECLADHGKQVKDVDQLSELVRRRLARVVCDAHRGRDGIVRVLTLDPRLETRFEQGCTGNDVGAFHPAVMQRFQQGVLEAYGAAVKRGQDPALITRASIRRFVADQMLALQPRVSVISYDEVHPGARVEPAGVVTVSAEAVAAA